MKIGSHVSIQDGLLGAVNEAISYGANTFMIYTGAPQNTFRRPIDDFKIEEAKVLMNTNNIEGFVVHAPYIINMASYKTNVYDLAISFLDLEITRTEKLGSKHLVLHPGAYTDKNLEFGINRIAQCLNIVLEKDRDVFICLETMAGKGTEVGTEFSQIAQIIDKVNKKDKIKVCFDTCHVWDSGYDIVNNFDDVMSEFDKHIGLDLIEVFHINGSLNKLGAKKDRHANIGALANNPKGVDNIGFDTIYKICHSKYAKDKFLILETPWINATENLYKSEIKLLRGV